MKTCFLLFAVIACIGFAGLFLGCCQEMRPVSPEPDFEQEKAELRSLARHCGIPESQCNSLSALGLISAIRIKLDNTEDYYGSTFSRQELELLSNLVSDEPELMQRIRKYDDYIKKLKGHRVILLP